MKKLLSLMLSIIMLTTLLLPQTYAAQAAQYDDAIPVSLNTQYIDNVYQNEYSHPTGLGSRYLYYTFNIPQRGSLNIDFKHQIAPSTRSWTIELYGVSDTGRLKLIGYDSIRGNDSSKNIGTFGLNAGKYYLEIDADTSDDYSFNLIYTPSDYYETEFNNDLSTATKLTVGSAILGNTSKVYDGSDYDYFTVDITKAGNYNIYFSGTAINKSYDVGWDVYFGTYDAPSMMTDLQILDMKNIIIDYRTIYLNPGTYYFRIAGSYGNYSLNISQEVVQPAKSNIKKPKSTTIKKLKSAKKSVTIIWKKVSGVKGYQIQVATDKKFKKNKKTVTIKKQKTTKTSVKKLKAKKKYYVRVRTYKTVNGKKIYSSWSKVKSVKTK